MSGDSNIEWTDKTWNPVVGCEQISPGCGHCYAKALHDLRHAAYKAGKKLPPQYAEPFESVQLRPDRLGDPLHWRKPQRVFVNSVSDLFHELVPFEFIDKVFAVMNATAFTLPAGPKSKRWHTYQILTKRPERMRDYMKSREEHFEQGEHPLFAAGRGKDGALRGQGLDVMNAGAVLSWPPPNVWLGVSVENSDFLWRIDELRETPAAVRFVSYEPALGSIGQNCDLTGIDWLICGGESGPKARPFDLDWARDALAKCRRYDTAFFMKQVGDFPVMNKAEWSRINPVRLLDHRKDRKAPVGTVAIWVSRHGSDPDEWPEDLRVREFPQSGDWLDAIGCAPAIPGSISPEEAIARGRGRGAS